MIEIPCVPDGESHWFQRTLLAGREYLLTFDWNQRAGHWSLTVADQDGAPIRAGITLTTGWPLLRGVLDARRPPGELAVFDALGLDEDPGFADLGARFALIYLDPEDLA